MKRLLLIVIASLISNSGFADDMPSEVKRLKTLRDKKVEEIDAAYNLALEKLKKKYAANENYKAIAYIENMQGPSDDSKPEEKQQDTGDSSSPAAKGFVGDADVYCKAQFGHFKNGKAIFEGDNFSSLTLIDIPEGYDDYEISLSPFKNEGLHFKVKKQGIVTLATHKQQILMEEDGWKIIDKVARLHPDGAHLPVYILQKELSAGVYSFDPSPSIGIRLLRKR